VVTKGMTKLIMFLLSSVLILMSPCIVIARTTIAYTQIDYLFGSTEETYGSYNTIANHLFVAPKINAFFIPPIRAELLLNNKEVDCLFPANIATMKNTAPLSSSLAINVIKAFIFSNNEYTNLGIFETKTLALRRGTSYGDVKNTLQANFLELNTDEQGIKMLTKNRVEGVIAYYSDIIGVYKALNLPIPYFNPDFPVYVASEHLVCFDNAENNALIELTNQKIIQLQENGKLAEWLTK
jgi:ABC-type amino acid transport substrate-binding protein